MSQEERCGNCRFWVYRDDAMSHYDKTDFEWRLGDCIRFPPKIMEMVNVYSDGSGGKRPWCLFPMTGSTQKCGEFQRQIEKTESPS